MPEAVKNGLYLGKPINPYAPQCVWTEQTGDRCTGGMGKRLEVLI